MFFGVVGVAGEVGSFQLVQFKRFDPNPNPEPREAPRGLAFIQIGHLQSVTAS